MEPKDYQAPWLSFHCLDPQMRSNSVALMMIHFKMSLSQPGTKSLWFMVGDVRNQLSQSHTLSESKLDRNCVDWRLANFHGTGKVEAKSRPWATTEQSRLFKTQNWIRDPLQKRKLLNVQEQDLSRRAIVRMLRQYRVGKRDEVMG